MKLDVQNLVSAILCACPKAPISFRSERVIVFRGVVLVISDARVTSDRINFTYEGPEDFIERLCDFGLMLKPHEIDKILSKYYMETL